MNAVNCFSQGPDPTRKGTREVAAPTSGPGPTPADPANQEPPGGQPEQSPRAPPLLQQPSTQNLAADDDPDARTRGDALGTRERQPTANFQQCAQGSDAPDGRTAEWVQQQQQQSDPSAQYLQQPAPATALYGFAFPYQQPASQYNPQQQPRDYEETPFNRPRVFYKTSAVLLYFTMQNSY